MKNYSIARSRRLRSTPYTSRIEKQLVTAYTSYNHMLLPAAFGSLEDAYQHLKENVQVWDVAGERQVEILGKDSGKLVQLMTCRDLSKSKIGRCYYCPIIDDNAGLVKITAPNSSKNTSFDYQTLVYPTIFNFNINIEILEKTKIQIYNEYGQLVDHEQTLYAGLHTINTESYTKGIYILKLKTTDSQKS